MALRTLGWLVGFRHRPQQGDFGLTAQANVLVQRHIALLGLVGLVFLYLDALAFTLDAQSLIPQLGR
jgi:hypothetical protein